jgi:hypothetical protein
MIEESFATMVPTRLRYLALSNVPSRHISVCMTTYRDSSFLRADVTSPHSSWLSSIKLASMLSRVEARCSLSLDIGQREETIFVRLLCVLILCCVFIMVTFDDGVCEAIGDTSVP